MKSVLDTFFVLFERSHYALDASRRGDIRSLEHWLRLKKIAFHNFEAQWHLLEESKRESIQQEMADSYEFIEHIDSQILKNWSSQKIDMVRELDKLGRTRQWLTTCRTKRKYVPSVRAGV